MAQTDTQVLKGVLTKIRKSVYDKFLPAWKERNKGIERNEPTESNFFEELPIFIEEDLECLTYAKEVKVKFNAKDYFYTKMVAAKNENDYFPISVMKKKLNLFLTYIRCSSFEEYLEKEFKGEEMENIKQQQLAILKGKKVEKENETKMVISYYFFTFHLIHETGPRYILEIDFTNIGSKKMKSKAKIYTLKNQSNIEIGTTVLTDEYLQITFLREDKKENTWMPLSLYFYIQKKAKAFIKDLPVLIGTYSGISNRSTNALSGEVILFQKEVIDASKSENINLAIKRRLHLNQHEVTIDIQENLQRRGIDGAMELLKTKSMKDTGLSVLNKLVGNYEAFCIFNDDREFYRLNLFVNEDYSTFIEESDSTFWGKMEVMNDTVISTFWKENRYEVEGRALDYIDGCMSINTKPIFSFDSNSMILQASFSGRTGNKLTECFTILLLKAEKPLPPKRYSKKALPEFLKERPEYSEVLKQFAKLEVGRWIKVKNILENYIDFK